MVFVVNTKLWFSSRKFVYYMKGLFFLFWSRRDYFSNLLDFQRLLEFGDEKTYSVVYTGISFLIYTIFNYTSIYSFYLYSLFFIMFPNFIGSQGQIHMRIYSNPHCPSRSRKVDNLPTYQTLKYRSVHLLCSIYFSSYPSCYMKQVFSNKRLHQESGFEQNSVHLYVSCYSYTHKFIVN